MVAEGTDIGACCILRQNIDYNVVAEGTDIGACCLLCCKFITAVFLEVNWFANN